MTPHIARTAGKLVNRRRRLEQKVSNDREMIESETARRALGEAWCAERYWNTLLRRHEPLLAAVNAELLGLLASADAEDLTALLEHKSAEVRLVAIASVAG